MAQLQAAQPGLVFSVKTGPQASPLRFRFWTSSPFGPAGKLLKRTSVPRLHSTRKSCKTSTRRLSKPKLGSKEQSPLQRRHQRSCKRRETLKLKRVRDTQLH